MEKKLNSSEVASSATAGTVEPQAKMGEPIDGLSAAELELFELGTPESRIEIGHPVVVRDRVVHVRPAVRPLAGRGQVLGVGDRHDGGDVAGHPSECRQGRRQTVASPERTRRNASPIAMVDDAQAAVNPVL